jgi:hypothetical protein
LYILLLLLTFHPTAYLPPLHTSVHPSPSPHLSSNSLSAFSTLATPHHQTCALLELILR